MGHFWDKLEQYLFDVFGLLLPGLTAGLAFLLLSGQTLGEVVKRLHEVALFQWAEIFGVLLAAYFVGHVLKTVSDWLYKGKRRDALEWFFILKGREGAFCLLGDGYRPVVWTVCERLKSQVGLDYQPKAFEKYVPHPLFKLSDNIAKNTPIKNMKDLHHAKYNAYKSLSLVFLIAFAFCLVGALLDGASAIRFLGPRWLGLLGGAGASLVLFRTFYLEYKTYQRWCALEAVNILFYYFTVLRKQPEPTP